MATSSVLFVVHEASRSGAPIALLRFLRWFKKNSARPCSILLLSDGELAPSFGELAETWSIDRSRWRNGNLRRSLLNGLGLGAWARRAENADMRRFAVRCSPRLVYVNSVASARAVSLLRSGIPV